MLLENSLNPRKADCSEMFELELYTLGKDFVVMTDKELDMDALEVVDASSRTKSFYFDCPCRGSVIRPKVTAGDFMAPGGTILLG